MKKIEMFACELCGAKYEDEARALDCEHSHKKVIEVNKSEYESFAEYPHSVSVRFSDDSCVVYRR